MNNPTQSDTTMRDRVSAAVSRIEARFNPHYGIDGASDSLALAADCRTLIAAIAAMSAPAEIESVCEACNKPCPESRLQMDGNGFMACEAAFTHDGSGDCPKSASVLFSAASEFRNEPCETKGNEDAENGCCRACRLRAALAHPTAEPITELQRMGESDAREFEKGDRVSTPYGPGTFIKWKWGQMQIEVDNFTRCHIDPEKVSILSATAIDNGLLHTGGVDDREGERAAIAAWLRGMPVLPEPMVHHADLLANAIERGDHLRATALSELIASTADEIDVKGD